MKSKGIAYLLWFLGGAEKRNPCLAAPRQGHKNPSALKA